MKYINSCDNITKDMLNGFFVGWPNPPSTSTHLKLLRESQKVVIALDEEKNQVIGFITAISDNVLSAYIPLLEVLPAYQDKGIGKQLVDIMLNELKDIYMVDICCDDDLVPFYQNFGMTHTNGMIIRNYEMQSGK
ncbi:MAG TPA: GNAT family N-acetyltransferase [Aliicoccus persicus]|uniref:GNAT family N-acetyltransferase n=1 Tax=Aliicoccus persicus TaxID=930138 RepID=A0A921DWV3_9STAP|nr:GNAT family N-acetyltransferase [Aliicoccus persicus]